MSALPTHFPPPLAHLGLSYPSEIPRSQSPVPAPIPQSEFPTPHSHSATPNPPSEIPFSLPSSHPTSAIPNPTFLTDLSNPSLSLRQVAEKHNTTVDALSVLLTDPAIAASIDALESTGARRARFVISVSLTEVAGSLLKQLNAANADLDLASQANSNTTPIPNTLRGYILRLRTRESARKTAAALMSIARFHPGATKPRSSETPSPKEGSDGRRGGMESGTPGGSENKTSEHHPEEPAPASFSPSRSEQRHDLPRNEFETNSKAPSSTQSPTEKLARDESAAASETKTKLAAPRSEEITQTSFSPSRSEQTQVLPRDQLHAPLSEVPSLKEGHDGKPGEKEIGVPSESENKFADHRAEAIAHQDKIRTSHVHEPPRPFSPAGLTDSSRQRGTDEWSEVSERHPRTKPQIPSHAESVQLTNHSTNNSTSHNESDFNEPELTEQSLAALANPVIEAINNSDPALLSHLSTHQAQSLILHITTEIALNDQLPPPSDDQLLPLITTRLRHLLTQPSGP